MVLEYFLFMACGRYYLPLPSAVIMILIIPVVSGEFSVLAFSASPV